MHSYLYTLERCGKFTLSRSWRVSCSRSPRTPTQISASSRIATPAHLHLLRDSLTAGAGTGPGESYPDYLQASLDQRTSTTASQPGISAHHQGRSPAPAESSPPSASSSSSSEATRTARPAHRRHPRQLDRIVATLQHSGIKVALAASPAARLRPRLHPAIQPDLHPARQKVPRPHASLPAQGCLRVPGMMQRDRTTPPPRQPGRRPQRLALVPPCSKSSSRHPMSVIPAAAPLNCRHPGRSNDSLIVRCAVEDPAFRRCLFFALPVLACHSERSGPALWNP